MGKLLILIIMLLCSSQVLAAQKVSGYYKSNGTYVQPHYRSNYDRNKYSNYSTRGNINPYTGRTGTKNTYYGQSYSHRTNPMRAGKIKY